VQPALFSCASVILYAVINSIAALVVVSVLMALVLAFSIGHLSYPQDWSVKGTNSSAAVAPEGEAAASLCTFLESDIEEGEEVGEGDLGSESESELVLSSEDSSSEGTASWAVCKNTDCITVTEAEHAGDEAIALTAEHGHGKEGEISGFVLRSEDDSDSSSWLCSGDEQDWS
jgi:hypothetical protein